LFIAPADFDRAIAFYRDTLRWRPVASWGGGGEPRGAIVNGGGIEVVLAERHAADDHARPQGSNEQRPTVHLRVDDIDARFRELAATAEIVVTLEKTHWGTRWFVVRDPDGNLIAYEQPLPASDT
jgi:uncharacterized glyoxalase superfamily protein PhnB